MKKKNLIYIIVSIFILILSGCDKETESKNNVIPEVSNKDSILLYNEYNSAFAEYDLKNNTYEMLDKDNIFQYSFKDASCPYYTSGHSNDNGFVILKQENNTLKKITAVAEDSAIFPLAYDKKSNSPYYFEYKDDNDDPSHSTVLKIDENEKKQIIAEDVNVGGTGVMCNGSIYYPVYDEKKDTFSVYKMDPASGDREKIADNIKTSDLYCSNGNLFFSDEKNIYRADNRKIRFTKGSENYFLDDMSVLIQYVVSDDASLSLVIRDYDNNILNTYKDVAGFTVGKDKLTIYEDGKTEIYKANVND